LDELKNYLSKPKAMSSTPSKHLRILHIISGDRWAGAEVMAYTLLKEMSKHHDVFAIILNPGELTQRLADIQIPVTILDERNLSSWQVFTSIKHTLKEIKPDIIHTHRQKENILGSIANSFSIRAKCLRTVHGDSEFEPKGLARVQVTLDNFCGRYLQQTIIAVSEDLRHKLMNKFPANKVVTVMNGIDPEETRLNLEYPDFKLTMPDKKHIGIVGRLDPVKRVDIFLKMAALLQKDHPEIPWHFHVFGEGQLEKKMKGSSKKLNINAHVSFHGHRIDIQNCIYGLDAVVMCSDHEGLPMTALECLAIGTPLIAHRTGGLTDLLKECPDRLIRHHHAEKYGSALVNLFINSPATIKYPPQNTIEHTSTCLSDLYSKLKLNNREVDPSFRQ
jgi:glycosyltransferase involved in cell wall biosynthesis